MPGAWPSDDGFDANGSIVFLPPSAVAHDPAVLGPFDGGAAAHDLRSVAHAVQHSGIAAQRTTATAAAVHAIAQGQRCAPVLTPVPVPQAGPRTPWKMETSFGWGSNVSRDDLQEMLDDIPPPESGDDDDAESASSSPRSGDPHMHMHADVSSGSVHTGTSNGKQEWAEADRGRPLADGSHFPPEQQRVIELQALMRAKDRDLQQNARDIDELNEQLAQRERERDLYFSRSADWEAKACDWECENTALRKELTHATSTISVLEEQSQQLQAELSKATASVNTLQIRVDELLQGEALITASQYEHHLTQLRSEAHTARTDAAAWRHEAAELRAILDEQISQDADAHTNTQSPGDHHVRTTALLFDVSVQTDVIPVPRR